MYYIVEITTRLAYIRCGWVASYAILSAKPKDKKIYALVEKIAEATNQFSTLSFDIDYWIEDNVFTPVTK